MTPVKRLVGLVILSLALSGSAAWAFVDQITASPAHPNSNQPITISFRSGACDGPTQPFRWQLQGSGATRDLIVEGLFALDPPLCVLSTATTAYNVGVLPAGDYQVHVKLVDPLDGLGGIPSPSFGSVNLTVTQASAVPVPATQPISWLVLVGAIFGAAWIGARSRVPIRYCVIASVLSCALLVSGRTTAAEALLLEVVLAPPPAGPSPEEIVEGYDFSSGQSPPFSALLVGSPVRAGYLLPIRAEGGFSAFLQANPDFVRSRLERTVLIAYPSEDGRAAAMTAIAQEPMVESVNLPLEYEFSEGSITADGPGLLSPAKSLSFVPDWRVQVNLPGAWQRQGGWARVGVLDNGYDLGHPGLIAFDGAGQFVGGNLITADALDVGRLGTAQTTGNCAFSPQPSTCDGNLDELEPVTLAAINDPCDVTAVDPVADGLMRPWMAGHGTHVLGLVAANHGSSGQPTGVCVNCSIQPMRVARDTCDALGRVVPAPNGSTIAAATTYLVDRGVQIVSMSHANNNDSIANNACASSPTSASCSALTYASNAGIVLVAASGNYRKRLGFPARDARVVAVGGVNETLAFWDEDLDPPPDNLDDCPFQGLNQECGSNFTIVIGQAKQEVVAPARSIDSTMYRGREWVAEVGCGDSALAPNGDGIGLCTGTSMSTPIVSGIFGLMRSVNPLLLPGDPEIAVDAVGLRDVLVGTTTQAQLGQPWDQRVGYGIVDADASLRSMLGVVATATPKNRVTPMFMLFGSAATDYAYSATPQGATGLILATSGGYTSSGAVTPGYLDFPHDPAVPGTLNPRANFYVLTSGVKPVGATPSLIPLYLLERERHWPAGCTSGAGCNINNRDVTLATSENDLEAMVADGFDYLGRQGYIFAQCAPEPACVPTGAERLYRKCKTSDDDCAVFLERDRLTMEGQGYTATYPLGGATFLGYAYPNVDTDGDLLVDGMERVIGTNPLLSDSDGDSVSDGLEYPQAKVPVSDPCFGPNVQCSVVPPLFLNGFESQ